METRRTVICSITFYKDIISNSMDKLRFGLACQTVANAHKKGYRIVIVDASPNPEIAKTLKELGAYIYPQTLPGMGRAQQLAFFYALYRLFFFKVDSNDIYRRIYPNDGIIVWIEIEKTDMIRLVPELVLPIEKNMTAVAIMKRGKKSWQTYPEFQRLLEQAANKVYEEATGRIGYDPLAGPVAFYAPILARHIFFNPGDYGLCDVYLQHFLPLLLPKEKVASVELDFNYPPEQKAMEEAADNETIREKRKWQFKTLCNNYRNMARTLNIGPYSTF